MFTFHSIQESIKDLLGFSVIVEGKRDKKALENFGLKDIQDISGKSIISFVESLSESKPYVILTDFDVEGEKLKSKLKDIMERKKFVINDRLRKNFKNTFKVVKIEDIGKIPKIMEDVYYGKISTINYKIFNRSRFLRRWSSREARCHWGNIWAD